MTVHHEYTEASRIAPMLVFEEKAPNSEKNRIQQDGQNLIVYQYIFSIKCILTTFYSETEMELYVLVNHLNLYM